MRRIASGLFLLLALTGAPALAVEEPKFTLVLQEGNFEIRDYGPAIAAEVTVTGDQWSAASKGFRLLAGYIFGGNASRRKIAMTAPVAQQRMGETIAPTSPVTQTQTDGAWVVRFTMPASYSLETLPAPDDPRVRLDALPPARLAVVRFSGYARESNVAANTAELLAKIRAHHLRTVGAVSIAQYDPPWTLWFLRRNEVTIEVEK